MKGQILKILRAESDVVSGETLSSHLNISRVSIWKHIKKLQEFGYNIQATPKGYRLINDPDVLYPWEFGDRELKIHYFDRVTSTMDVAGNLARNHAPDFTVVIAGRQSKGRGRLKRTWLSSQGGLYFTIILRPQIPPALSSRVNFAASMILARTLSNMFHIDARVKWPNDILIHERKVAGLLSEMEAETDMVTFINIGMGVNVNNDPSPREPMAISLKKILGRNISKKQLLSEFLNEFENRMNNGTLDNVISEWKTYTMTIGRQVTVVTPHDEFKGLAMDVDDTGALMLKLQDGSIKKIIYGDCFH
ncbi:MAG: biotin--[acetyl-CoA-carboxylase] ligase [Desulfobacterales bacterium]|jgi:BirA family biotin operon repressor/biotin-[acetyl-CoA-carboxylase] ligase